jgi:Ca-dependent carbohydrate-binding module xylan-binding
MHNSFRWKKLLKILGIIFTFCFLLVFLVHFGFSGFPAETKKTDANILTVEGFQPEPALERVKDEFEHGGYDMLIITGLNLPRNYYEVSMNGYLIFYPKIKVTNTHADDFHIIEVNAFSELGGKNCAHFNFFVNDSLVGDFYAGKLKKKYGVSWKGKLEDIDSVMIQFDNDKFGKWGDRNLYVKEIIIDHKITIPYLYNSVYDIGSLDGKRRIINNFSSNAEQSRNELISMSVNPSRIVAVSPEGNYINNTLKSALAFRDWLKASKYDVKGINLISFGPHARRKYMIYNKILGKNYNVGIIYFPDYKNRDSLKNILNELREFFGLVYYRFILIFY